MPRYSSYHVEQEAATETSRPTRHSSHQQMRCQIRIWFLLPYLGETGIWISSPDRRAVLTKKKGPRRGSQWRHASDERP